ncbi:MAG: hypothetical protein H7338_24135, partial [Candidatus Sericytochromatia bacterium]|nr:hypothetical protein [Candidatus Sericytochromatia bacterium]
GTVDAGNRDDASAKLKGMGHFPTQVAPEGQRGRMIGGISTLKTIGAMVAALLTPGLYSADPAACFGLTAAVLVAGVIGLGLALAIDERRQRRRAGPAACAAQSPLAAAADGA